MKIVFVCVVKISLHVIALLKRLHICISNKFVPVYIYMPLSDCALIMWTLPAAKLYTNNWSLLMNSSHTFLFIELIYNLRNNKSHIIVEKEMYGWTWTVEWGRVEKKLKKKIKLKYSQLTRSFKDNFEEKFSG